MGYGIDFSADIYLNRYTNDNISVLEDDIEDLKTDIALSRLKLAMFAASNPKDIIPDEWNEEPIRFISNFVEEEVQNILDYSRQLMNLEYYLEFLENNPNFKYNED